MGDAVLQAKLLVGVAMVAAGTIVFASPRLERVRAFLARHAVWCLLASRLALYVAVFHVAGIAPQSDVAGYYAPQARAALAGQLPYRDFPSSYGPLFPYIAAVPLALHDDARLLILLAILLEAAAFAAWHAVARRVHDPATCARGTLLYLFNPLPLLNVALNGQNQVLVSLFIALALLLILRDRPAASGALYGLGLAATKFLALVFAPLLLLAARRQLRWSLAFAAIAAALFTPFALAGADLLFPFRFEGARAVSGNLPFLLGSLVRTETFLDRAMANAVLLLIALVPLGLIAIIRPFPSALAMRAIAVAALVVILLSRKGTPTYLMMVFPAICFIVAWTVPAGPPAGYMLVLGLFGIVATLEPSLWHRWFGAAPAADVLGEVATGAGVLERVLFVGIEAALVGGYLLLLVTCFAQAVDQRWSDDTAPLTVGREGASGSSPGDGD